MVSRPCRRRRPSSLDDGGNLGVVLERRPQCAVSHEVLGLTRRKQYPPRVPTQGSRCPGSHQLFAKVIFCESNKCSFVPVVYTIQAFQTNCFRFSYNSKKCRNDRNGELLNNSKSRRHKPPTLYPTKAKTERPKAAAPQLPIKPVGE